MARLVPRALVVTVTLVVALAAVGSSARAAETRSVTIANFVYDPQTITVNVGDTVAWRNTDQAPHTVTADSGGFDSGRMDNGAEFSFTFTEAGTFPYYCTFHGGPGGAGQSGTVVVQAAAAQPTAAPAAPAQQPAAATGSIEAGDQAVVNNTITVARATISQDGWIAVHKAGPDGSLLLTPLVGVAPIKAGDNGNVVIQLTEPVAAGAPLWPMLHIDAGTLGTYEFPGGPDTPVVANGMPVMQQITIQAGADAQPAPAAQPTPPAQLPNTGAGDEPLGWLVGGALALLAGGALVVRRVRARGV